VLKNKIAKRAYEIFLHRGAQPGQHFDDWVKAEKEVMAEIAREKACHPRSRVNKSFGTGSSGPRKEK
jgi:hypothetical protein